MRRESSAHTFVSSKRNTMLRIRHPFIILALLTAAYTLSFMDRYVLNLLLNDVKRDFHLSEMQAGLIAGAGFAVLYALMALPMGVIADRGSRTRLAAIGIGLWSAVTMLCGLAGNFVQLLLCRTGVGIGEATLTCRLSYDQIPVFFSTPFHRYRYLFCGYLYRIRTRILARRQNPALYQKPSSH